MPSQRYTFGLRITAILRFLAQTLIVTYTTGIAIWLIARVIWPDSRWWGLALANTFAFYLFAPLIVLLPAAWWTRGRWTLRAILIPTAAFLWMFGPLFVPRLPLPSQASGPTITVMTFNVWGYNGRPQAIASAIRQVNPDIVILQELNWWLMDDLQKALDGKYPFAASPRGYLGGAQGVLSRYPILSTEWIVPPGVWRWAQYAEIDVNGRRVHVLNIHLSSTSGAINWRDLIERVKRTYAQRELEARQFQEFLASLDGPVIVAGDFNTTDQTTAYRLLTRGLKDAFRVAGWGLGHTYPARTWHFGRFRVPARLVRIDYITYSAADFDAIHARVGPSDGVSDHLPVVAQLRLR